ncbi:MAG: nicotinate phosphoribosyltransferase [Trueperaceae bacterium]
MNLITATDSYKVTHFKQYPPKTSQMFSYIESRGGVYSETKFFGLQSLLKTWLENPVKKEHISEAERIFKAHFGADYFPKDGWLKIVEKYNGLPPVKIRAVPEGMVVPTHNVLVTVESTDEELFWLPSWLETQLLRTVWYGTTVATVSHSLKKLILSFLERTADDPKAEIAFKLHDFGARGVSSAESAGLGGCAHLTNFMGSDTVEALLFARKYYQEPMAAFSIPAMEHSTVTSWGRPNETDAYSNFVRQFGKPGAVIAAVSDSYDLYNAVEYIWGEELKQQVQDSGATIVVRPDSGDPPLIVLRTLQLLESKYGATKNSKGYKVIHGMRVIQGDGINEDSIRRILDLAERYEYSATNIAFGMGGALLQQVNRDTQKFAMKCSEVVVDGVPRPVSKDPVTDPGKKSKTGRLELYKIKNRFVTSADEVQGEKVLRTVYENGELLVDDSLATIRSR